VMAATALRAVVGSNAGALLANSRLLQSLADQGDISAWFGRRSARFGTPVVAIALSSILVLALALTGTFQSLVVLAVGTRVLVYMGVALAAIRLRRADRKGTAPPAGYRMPAAPLVLAIVMLGCGIILLQMTTPQAVAIALGLTAGLLLFFVRRAASGRTP
ncbi:APC family permease, partial [Sphaerospermopsis aphanizomenoides BCCUSP55]|uniref:APC family permease n=1 Tax=Sphaerospermopsis aphanizomenoides TaxID=459663 RepID=UPI001902DC2D